MSDFTPITTQDEFDAAIRERLNRAEQKFAQKYSDYDEIKSNIEKLDRKVILDTRSVVKGKHVNLYTL